MQIFYLFRGTQCNRSSRESQISKKELLLENMIRSQAKRNAEYSAKQCSIEAFIKLFPLTFLVRSMFSIACINDHFKVDILWKVWNRNLFGVKFPPLDWGYSENELVCLYVRSDVCSRVRPTKKILGWENTWFRPQEVPNYRWSGEIRQGVSQSGIIMLSMQIYRRETRKNTQFVGMAWLLRRNSSNYRYNQV